MAKDDTIAGALHRADDLRYGLNPDSSQSDFDRVVLANEVRRLREILEQLNKTTADSLCGIDRCWLGKTKT